MCYLIKIASFFSIFVAVVADCPIGEYNLGDSCYKFIQQPKSFEDARAVCLTRTGYDLLSISNLFVNTFISSTGEVEFSTTRKFFWIGLTRNGQSNFKWVNGQKLEYQNWNMGQPNVYNCTSSDVVNGRWLSTDCTITQPFVCQGPNRPDYTSTSYASSKLTTSSVSTSTASSTTTTSSASTSTTSRTTITSSQIPVNLSTSPTTTTIRTTTATLTPISRSVKAKTTRSSSTSTSSSSTTTTRIESTTTQKPTTSSIPTVKAKTPTTTVLPTTTTPASTLTRSTSTSQTIRRTSISSSSTSPTTSSATTARITTTPERSTTISYPTVKAKTTKTPTTTSISTSTFATSTPSTSVTTRITSIPSTSTTTSKRTFTTKKSTSTTTQKPKSSQSSTNTLIESSTSPYSDTNGTCPSGWTPFESNCYLVYNNVGTWSAASDNCRANDAFLVSIHSEEENNFVIGLSKKGVVDQQWADQVWIGLEGGERNNLDWTDDTDVDFLSWSKISGRFCDDCGYFIVPDGLANDDLGHWFYTTKQDTQRAYVCKRPFKQ